jgi:hypothetical protein
VQRKSKGRKRALIYGAIINHLWKSMLKTYAYFFEKYKKIDTEDGTLIDLEHGHKKALEHIYSQLRDNTLAALKKGGMQENDALSHSRHFALEFVDLLEQLLLVWPRYSSRRGMPYPTTRDSKKLNIKSNENIFRRTNKFMREFAVFSIGHAGWRRKAYKGY